MQHMCINPITTLYASERHCDMSFIFYNVNKFDDSYDYVSIADERHDVHNCLVYAYNSFLEPIVDAYNYIDETLHPYDDFAREFCIDFDNEFFVFDDDYDNTTNFSDDE